MPGLCHQGNKSDLPPTAPELPGAHSWAGSVPQPTAAAPHPQRATHFPRLRHTVVAGIRAFLQKWMLGVCGHPHPKGWPGMLNSSEAWELEAEPSATCGDTVLPRGEHQAGPPWYPPDITSAHPRGGEAKDWPLPHPSTRLTANLRAEAPSVARTFLRDNREWAVRLRGPHTSRVDSPSRTEPRQSPCPLQAGALDHMAPTHCPPGVSPRGSVQVAGG